MIVLLFSFIFIWIMQLFKHSQFQTKLSNLKLDVSCQQICFKSIELKKEKISSYIWGQLDLDSFLILPIFFFKNADYTPY